MIRQWRALEPWIDVASEAGPGFAHPTVPLKTLLNRRVAPIDKSARPLADLNVIAKVTFGGELFLRGAVEKRNYKGPLFEALPGDLIISKIRVGQGSFCVVPSQYDHVAVSPEYPVYVPDAARISSRFLAMVLRTPAFLRTLTGSASGNTTKRRIKPSFFESLRIPLPDLAEQQAIVAAYEAALAGAAAKEAEAATAEAEALAAFEAALGFAPPVPLPDRPVFVASFKDLDRWSHEGVLRRMTGGAASTAPWPMVSLRDIIAGLEVGWSPKALDRPAYGGEWGVLKLGAVSFGSFDPSANKALRPGTSPRQACEVKTGDILISRGNVARLVASCVLVDATPQRLMIPDLIFRVVGLRSEAVEPAFLVAALRTGFVRNQVAGRLTGTSPTMKKISTGGLLSLTFPLPPLDQQRALVAALDAGRTAAATLRREAAEARAAAWAAFEAAVYASEPAAMGQKEAA